MPAVGKIIVGFVPTPTDGAPPGLRLQLIFRTGTPYLTAVNAVMFPPAQTVLDDTVNGVTKLVNSTVCPSKVIVHGLFAPIQVPLHPRAPMQSR